MNDAETAATGRVYLRQCGKTTPTPIEPAIVTNGPAVSPDGTRLYHVDTFARRIDEHAIADDGTLGRPRRFVAFEPGAGNPDGVTIDAEGCVWVGMFGGWSALRFSPDGALIDRVAFPTANVTKIAFVEGETIAYATTARLALNADQLSEQPLAGDLFRFNAGVKGVPAPILQG